ncbi:MAG TPA: hypothetical protein VN634_17035 [Candidatus Limnocylindrales bacterium]|nr:hypothetical protein [Candidatus Limnocylindrales bacterium]
MKRPLSALLAIAGFAFLFPGTAGGGYGTSPAYIPMKMTLAFGAEGAADGDCGELAFSTADCFSNGAYSSAISDVCAVP